MNTRPGGRRAIPTLANALAQLRSLRAAVTPLGYWKMITKDQITERLITPRLPCHARDTFYESRLEFICAACDAWYVLDRRFDEWDCADLVTAYQAGTILCCQCAREGKRVDVETWNPAAVWGNTG